MVNIGDIVILNSTEQAFCQYISDRRHSNNTSNNVKDYNVLIGSKNDFEFQGICGELAFCKLFGIYPNFIFDISVRNSSNDSGDAVLPNGKNIDVKTTRYKNGKLIAGHWKKSSKCDYLALMVGEKSKYEYRGAIASKDFFIESRLGTLGYVTDYIAEQSDLKNII